MRRLGRIPVFLAGVFVTLVCSQAAEEQVKLGGLDVAVWSEPGEKGGRQPVIIFSHGFHGSATQSRFLMEALAKAGYLVFAPNHRDAVYAGGQSSWLDWPEEPFKNASAWNDASYRDRADDIRQLLVAIATDERYRSRADLSRLGLAGHSLGGYTVLGLAGGWPSWKLPGVKAVLALSPYSQPYVEHDTLRNLGAPVMFQGGTRDFGITPFLTRSGGAYDLSASPKYLVEFQGIGHLGWTDRMAAAHAGIAAESVAFFDRYVKGSPPSPILTQPLAGAALLRYSSELGSGASPDAASSPRLLGGVLQRRGEGR